MYCNKLLGQCRIFCSQVRKSSNFAAMLEGAIEEKLQKKQENHVKKQKEKYNGKVKKREWEFDDETSRKRQNLEPADRVKRKKSVILMGYSGVNYFGMQRNPEMKTIEEELLKAMLKNNWITEEVFNQPQLIQFQRAARTDKGVSAAQQIVSMKLPEEVNIEDINKDLPEQIRIFGVKRVTKSFNSKTNCDARTYSYTFPTIALSDKSENLEDEDLYKKYRLPAERLEKVNEILKMFEGTKNFHNFTSKKHCFDPSAKRYIMSFKCEPPFLPDNCEVEFARIRIKGQSFMLHQIRKMVGLTIAVMRGETGSETIKRTLGIETIDVPMAPGLGLVLDRIHYEKYDERYGDDGMHEPLSFDKEQETIEQFFMKHILTTIIDTETSEMSMVQWIKTLCKHNYDIREPIKDKEPNSKDKKRRTSEDDDDE